jgi:hypothetical protein
MKVFAETLVETVVDRVCDVCKESVVEEYGELDGNTYHLDLCESCFKVALCALKSHKRSLFMFDDDEKNLPDEKFGLAQTSQSSLKGV